MPRLNTNKFQTFMVKLPILTVLVVCAKLPIEVSNYGRLYYPKVRVVIGRREVIPLRCHPLNKNRILPPVHSNVYNYGEEDFPHFGAKIGGSNVLVSEYIQNVKSRLSGK